MHSASRGQPTFTLGDDEMELGVGIHGGSAAAASVSSADAISVKWSARSSGDLDPAAGAEGLLPSMDSAEHRHELYLMVNLRCACCGKGVRVSRHHGQLRDILEMAGCSITVSLLDDALRALWDAPVHRSLCAGEHSVALPVTTASTSRT